MLKRWFNREAVVADHEIVPGVDKPTLILVTMVVAKMLKEPKDCRKLHETNKQEYYKYGLESSSDVSASFLETRTVKSIGYEDVTTGYLTSRHVIKCGKETFELTDKKEQKILEEGFKKALELKVKFEAVEKENARQDAALAAIDKFFKVEKPEAERLKQVKEEDGVTVTALTPCPPYATREIARKHHPDASFINRPNGKIDCWYPEKAEVIVKEVAKRKLKDKPPQALCKDDSCLFFTRSWHGYCAKHAPRPV